MLGRAAHLPQPLVGFAPVRDRGLDLAREHRPAALVEPVAGPGVQVDRVEQHPPDVVLALVPGAVADADRAGALVAGQVVESLLGQLALAADPVHDLQVGVLLGQVGDEVEEVVRLPVEAEGVQAPEHEGRVAQPGVAVVVVALAAGGLRQRRRRRRQQRPGRRVDQALQRQRGPLQVLPPGVVGEGAAADPLVPEVAGPGQPLMRVGEGLRRRAVAPRQRAEHLLAGPQPAPGDRPRPLEAQVQVGGQPDLRLVADAAPRPRRSRRPACRQAPRCRP